MPTKGHSLEEILRAYFAKAGFFVIRGVPFRFEGENLTDIDLWLYERANGTTRRVQIVDIKYRQKPKAAERLFWTSGIAKALGVDGAVVATTDKRASLRKLAKKLEISLIDGNDLQRIKTSSHLKLDHRLSDEEFLAALRSVDRSRRSRALTSLREDLLKSILEGFGPASAVRSLACFTKLCQLTVESHPNSEAAQFSGRLAYLTAAIACESLDLISMEAAFRTLEEKYELLVNAIRYGATDRNEGLRNVNLALELIRQYSPAANVSNAVDSAVHKDLDRIPAEIIAEQSSRIIQTSDLFEVGRQLERACYSRAAPNFDALETDARSFVGAALDFASVRRAEFASSWLTDQSLSPHADVLSDVGSQDSLFKKS